MKYIGRDNTKVLFSLDNVGVLVDELTKAVDIFPNVQTLLASGEWDPSFAPKEITTELAEAAYVDLDIKVFSTSGDRLYTIPKSVQSEAKRALEWRKEHDRAGTPVGINTARTLAKGGQIGIRKVRHIAKYFPRHEVDKKGKGYKPGQDGYPSNGRIAWALWGGNSAKSWASAIVERENKKPMTAGYDPVMDLYDSPITQDLNDFIYAKKLPKDFAPKFFIRVSLDGKGIDRLYKVDPQGSVCVWDDGCWDDLGNMDHDIATYDKTLDDPYDKSNKIHVPVDIESAVIIAAFLDSKPFENVSISEINQTEAKMVSDSIFDLDWEMMDDVMVAAGESPIGAGDGVYSPEERAENAQQQVRDKNGRFAKDGGRVVVGGDPNVRGIVKSQNPANKSVSVELDSGETVELPGYAIEDEDEFKPISNLNVPETVLDTSGILGEPRTPIDQIDARLPGRLPPLTGRSVQLMLNDWPSWVADQRLEPEAAPTDTQTPFVPKKSDAYSKWTPATAPNAYNDPYLNKWLKNPNNRGWYNPIVPEGTVDPVRASAGKPISSPEKSDVPPIYMAIVAEDDPQAVMDLVALIPASTESTTAAAYVRKDGQWAVNDKILTDLNSPTPPPIVVLDNETLANVLDQVDAATSTTASLVFRVASTPTVFAEGESSQCPIATQDIGINLKNRKNAIDTAMYGPLNPAEPNEEYWAAIGIEWNVDVETAKKQRCGNCAVFIQTPEMLSCIETGLTDNADEFDSINEAGELGYCEAFDFKCASARTCRAWVGGGPVTASIFLPQDRMFTESWADSKKLASLTASGIFGNNKDKAQRLREYWTTGMGGQKIGWGTDGDLDRSNTYLAKYLGPKASSFSALLHRDVTGVWPEISGIKTESEILSKSYLGAQSREAKNRVLVAGGNTYEEPKSGAEFFIPLVIPENIESGDGRIFKDKSIDIRELPLPLLWQIKTADGHAGSVVVGKITTMERTDKGIGNARGVFDSGEYGREAERLVRGGFIRGVSADMDKFEASEESDDEAKNKTDKIKTGKIKITKARVMAVTIVPKPAFQECKIILAEQFSKKQEDEVIPDGVYVENVDALEALALVACGAVAGSIPVTPPSNWFDNPKLKQPTGLTVTDDGQVFGHIAAWHVDHIGMSFGTKPPRSRSKYSYFHTGIVRTEDGKDVPVGQLTLAGGHASLEASAAEAVRHYDDTASAIADVHAGEDSYGIWVAGALRPGTGPEQVRALRASAPSGDWRPIKGHLELVAVCQVNVPGFPIARARVASGQVMALVAAGAQTLAKLRNDPLTELTEKVAKLEEIQSAPLVAAADIAKSKFKALEMAIRAEELSAKVSSMKKDSELDYDYMNQGMDDDPENELAVVTRRVRERLAKERKALPDGSYPIRNVSDLKNAIQAYGRAKPGKRAAVQKHIMRRARALNRSDMIPNTFKEAALEEFFAILEDESVTAAGGLDRNRGNAEELRRYWTKGVGAAKIRWGAPGDWTRCVGYLSKYMGPRSKGYCQLRHKEATGVYTGSRLNPGNENSSESEINITIVSNNDLAQSIDQIMSSLPADFDASWKPEDDVIEMILISMENLDLENEDSETEIEAVLKTEFSSNADSLDLRSRVQIARSTLTAAIEPEDIDIENLNPEEIALLEEEAKSQKQDELNPEDSRAKYTPQTQPRDAQGKFRQILARIKQDSGVSGLDRVLDKVRETENFDSTGDYASAAKAAVDLIGIIDRLDSGALNPTALENVRSSAGELGKVIANLPFNFADQSAKLRYSDVPPALKDLIEDMITRVEAKIGPEDAAIATTELKSFMSGSDLFSQSEISSQMSKLLRLLT